MKIDHIKIFNTIKVTQNAFNLDSYNEYIKKIGIKNLKPIHLDYLFEKNNSILAYPGFNELYSIASSNEANKTMKWWTVGIGIMTGIVTICTILMLIIA